MKGKIKVLILRGKPLATLYFHLGTSILISYACLLLPWNSSLFQWFANFLLRLTSQVFFVATFERVLTLFHWAVSDYSVKETLPRPSQQLWDYNPSSTIPGNPGCSVVRLITAASYRFYLVRGE